MRNSFTSSTLLFLAVFSTPAWGHHPAKQAEPLPPPPPPSSCPSSPVQVITPVKIRGGHHLYFRAADLAFLNDPAVQVDQLILKLSVRAKKKELKDLSVALNGIRSSCADARGLEYGKERGDSIDVVLNLHRYRLNGGPLLRRVVSRFLKRKGLIEISVAGRRLFIKAASLEVSTRPATCPPSDPPPTPVAPHTTLDSASPSSAVTNLTNMTFNFSSDQPGVNFFCALDGAAPVACASPQSYSLLANGLHQFKVYAQNAAGLADPVGASYSWQVDTVPPAVKINSASPAEATTSSSSMMISFSADKVGTFKCSLNGAAYSVCASPVTYNGLMEGVQEVRILMVDQVGNVSTEPARYSWTVDLTAPTVSFTQIVPEAAVTNATQISLSFAADESALFECSIDQGAFQSCASPLNLDNLVEGAHSVTVEARDVAGNQSLPASYSWNIDVTAPVVSLGNVVPAPGVTNAHNLSVEFNASEIAQTYCSLDGGAWQICASPFTPDILSEGTHSVAVMASDRAGNNSEPVSLSWMMDFTSPQVSFGEMLPSAMSSIRTTELTVNVNSTEPIYFSAFLDGVDLNQRASPVILQNLSEGPHRLELLTVDYAGNPGNTLVHDFVVDLTPPLLSLSADVGSLTRQSMITLSFSANEDSTYVCNLDNAGFVLCSSPFTQAGLSDGDHHFRVYATDAAGNASDVSGFDWTVDTSAPQTSLLGASPSGSVIGVSSLSLSFGADEAGAVFECSLDGAAFASCSSPALFSNLSDGAHNVQVRAIDLAGNVEATPQSYSFNVNAQPPLVTISSGPAALINSRTAQFVFNANKAASFVCSIDGAAFAACASPFSTPSLLDGTHSFAVRATDSFGHQSAAAAYSWTIDATAPTLGTVTPTVTNTSFTIKWKTNEPATTALLWGVGSNVNNVVPDDGVLSVDHVVTISGLTPLQNYSYQMLGKDQAGNQMISTKRTIRTNP